MTGASDKPGRCAICGKPVETQAYRPFCSRRCGDLDLQRWLAGRYVVPGQPLEEGGAGAFDEDDQG